MDTGFLGGGHWLSKIREGALYTFVLIIKPLGVSPGFESRLSPVLIMGLLTRATRSLCPRSSAVNRKETEKHPNGKHQGQRLASGRSQ